MTVLVQRLLLEVTYSMMKTVDSVGEIADFVIKRGGKLSKLRELDLSMRDQHYLSDQRANK